MASRSPRPWPLYLGALVALSLGIAALVLSVRWYERPIAGVLVDPEAVVSNLGMPYWAGARAGLRYPDVITEVDGERLTLAPPGDRGAAFDAAVERASEAGRDAVEVKVDTPGGERVLRLPLTPLDPLAWWLLGGGGVLAGALYAGAGLIALYASPEGRLARASALSALALAAFLSSLFDFHTSRALVPVFHVAFALVPAGLVLLALRLPDDAGALRRFPFLAPAIVTIGLGAGFALVGAALARQDTLPLRMAWGGAFSSAIVFFLVVQTARFVRARGERRDVLRILLAATFPTHVFFAVGLALSHVYASSANGVLVAVPALALTPLSTLAAFIRHNLWGSRALLSRVVARVVVATLACLLAVTIGAALAASLGVPFGAALASSAATGCLAAALVVLALSTSDDQLFPSRAQYKPTIEQLSDELTSITSPEEVQRAIELTVQRWLPCETVSLDFASPPADDPLASPAAGPPDAGRPLLGPGDGQAELALPLLYKGAPVAFLRVGRKRGGALFTSEDADLLRTIANQGALALAHARSYAELEERRRQQALAFRDEKGALLETVAAEIVHEVRYPINFFRSVFRRGASGGRLDDEEIDIGCEEVDRLERLVLGLKRVATRRLHKKVAGVGDVLLRAEMLLRDKLGGRPLEVDLSGPVGLRCDFDQVTQVLVNLLSNALDAAGPKGKVGVEWTTSEAGATLAVWDDGPGFEGDASRLFAPWFTTKAQGTGLGLAIAHRLVRAHGWDIEVTRVEDRTRFLVRVPAPDLVAPSERAPAVREPKVADAEEAGRAGAARPGVLA